MSGEESQPNIVLVSVDSLRADHCGYINSDSELTPTIDRLAEEGTAFTQAVAPGPRTPSSIPVIFTGEFPTEYQDWRMGDWQARQSRIADHMERFRHLSEQLQQQGYETAAFTTNPWTTRESHFDYGFDEFNEISANSPDVSSKHLSGSPLFKLADAGFETLPVDPVDWGGKKEWFSQWTGYFDLIAEKVEALEEPFFLWVFILDSHQPYVTPREYREESAAWEMYYSILRYWQGEISGEEIPDSAKNLIEQAYRDAVRSVDGFMEALMDEVRPFDPVTVFHSDHGEAFGEHGTVGHKPQLFEENLRVPFFVHNNDEASRDISGQFSLQNLIKIIQDISRSEFDTEAYTQPFIISKTERLQKYSVRTPYWKLITEESEERLYNLQSDPDERRDVSGEYEDIQSSLNAVLQRHKSTQSSKHLVIESVAEFLSERNNI